MFIDMQEPCGYIEEENRLVVPRLRSLGAVCFFSAVVLIKNLYVETRNIHNYPKIEMTPKWFESTT